MTADRDPPREPPSDITRLARDGHLPQRPAAARTAGSGADEATLVLQPAIDDPTVVSSAPPPAAPPKAETPLALPAGYRLHEYRVDKVIGQGGFGITYLARDVNLDTKVAIKEYLPQQVACRTADITVEPRSANDADFFEKGLENYLVEARTLATFRHPNIVRVARFFEANNTAYMVLEYERGESLKRWWRANSRLPEVDLLTLLLPLLDGLAVVHASGFLHRDIKPDNIYVRDDDGSLVLLDFGAARHTSAERTEDNNFVTPGYGPIEQYFLGEQGPWTDIYALGATLYWMVSGRKPIDAPERMSAEDPLPSAVQVGEGRYSEAFLRAIDWALEPETQDRPRDMDAFRTALFAAHPSALNLQEALRAGEGESAEPVGWSAILRSPRLARARVLRAVKSLARPDAWPLAVKMSIAMVATALTPMLITTYYNYQGSVERVSAAELRNIEQLAGSVAGRLAQLLSDSAGLATFLGKDPQLAALLEKPAAERAQQALARLKDVVSANPDVQVATVLDPDGKALVSSFPGVAGNNFGFRQYFLEAMRGNSHVTGVIVGATAGEPGVFFSNPVLDAAGKVIGVVTLRIKGSVIAGILESSRGASERIAMLVDGDGIIVHHTDPAHLYKSLAPLPADKAGEILYDQRFRRERIDSAGMPELAARVVRAAERGHVSFRSTFSGKDEIAGFAPVRGHDWVVAMTQSREAFERPLLELFRTVLYSVLLVGLVFLVLTVWFARRIVRPIESLTAAAHALKSADYEKANVRVTSGDEIGQLTRVFNVMIDVLRQRDRELRARQGKEGR